MVIFALIVEREKNPQDYIVNVLVHILSLQTWNIKWPIKLVFAASGKEFILSLEAIQGFCFFTAIFFIPKKLSFYIYIYI